MASLAQRINDAEDLVTAVADLLAGGCAHADVELQDIAALGIAAFAGFGGLFGFYNHSLTKKSRAPLPDSIYLPGCKH